MWEFVKAKWTYFIGSFHNNETIIWNRFQMALGAAWIAVTSNTDQLAKIIENPKYLGYALMAIAAVGEYLRRRGATFTGADDKDSK